MIEPHPHAESELRTVFRDAAEPVPKQRRPAQAHHSPRSKRFVFVSRIATLVVLMAAIAWFFTLRPEALGGPASYVMVSGISMEPTYQNRDMVIMRRSSSYKPGDIIAYHVPAGDVGAGSLVIHRVVGSDEKGIITKGDNRKGEDLWRPQQSDVIGKAWVHLPGLGGPFSMLRTPIPMAALAGLFTVYFVLTFNRPGRRSDPD